MWEQQKRFRRWRDLVRDSGGARAFAVWGKRLCCHPCQSDQVYNQGIFRIRTSGVWTNFWVPLLFFPFFPVPYPSPLPSNSTPLPLPSLKSRPLKSSCRRSGERCKFPRPKSNLVHFSLKILHPSATNLKSFLKIKWPNFMHNFHILCRIWKRVNSAKHWIAITSKTATGQYGSSIYSFTAGEWSVRSAV